ncbi:MAG TPA: hypothetical protein VFS58_03135 [Steroidobacteraceae bacterium]|nr:hypothetical protein [Steroidobacteraceae bacterium]
MNKTVIMALAALALAACETPNGAGTGSGNVRGTQKPVAFTWESDDSNSGNITATFGTGRVFKGEYVQISRDIRGDNLEPLWDGWDRPRNKNAWRYWNASSRSEFVRENDGRVLANLHSANGEYMRCRFTLISPQRGMAGGGEGRCQLSESGKEINAEFARQS